MTKILTDFLYIFLIVLITIITVSFVYDMVTKQGITLQSVILFALLVLVNVYAYGSVYYYKFKPKIKDRWKK